MRTGFYTKTACGNLIKNYRFFIPRILTEAGLLGSYYIVRTLTTDQRLQELKGGAYIPSLMLIGSAVIAFLSVILMLYSNSFLMKQRKREFGLYNVLGMEKRHIDQVLFWESLMVSVAAILLGLAFGVLFYKLCSLLICKLLDSAIVLGFYFIHPSGLLRAASLFAVVDLVTFGLNCLSVHRLKPVELLASRRSGEKEPKVKWLLLIIGIILLALGYYLSVTTTNPLQALSVFFLAVFSVIIGTYFLFVSGSIFVLKLLKRNKTYYYQKHRMSAVSGLLYRMKQNAVGLASIAVLSCGVLVMISTTVSLYAGMRDSLDSKYPQDLYVSADYGTADGRSRQIPGDILADLVLQTADRMGQTVRTAETQRYLEVSFPYHNGHIELTKPDNASPADLGKVCTFLFMTQERYNALSDVQVHLSAGEMAMAHISTGVGNMEENFDALWVGDERFAVRQTVTYYPVYPHLVTTNTYGVVVADDETLEQMYRIQRDLYGQNASAFIQRLAVTFTDRTAAHAVGDDISRELIADIKAYAAAQPDYGESCGIWQDSYWETEEQVYGMYGSFLFLGILLGLVCLFATGLIIYYKQISEGYEDRERFQIMQKIGMSSGEVRKTILSQIVLVFFLPLIVAGIHVVFAFPILSRLLHLLLYSNDSLFIVCSLAVYLIYAAVYFLIYFLTAGTYYKIVN